MPKKFELSKMLIHLLFILLSLAIVLPFLLVVAVSLTDEASLTDKGYQFFPETFSLEAYRYLLDAPDILLRAYGVTITVTVIGALAGLLLTAMTAYVISRPDYRYKRVTTFYVFFTMLFSGGLVPSYILITQYLHLKDSLLALILPVLLSPFNIMVMKGFMSKIPLEIVESAKIDGARELRIFSGSYCRYPRRPWPRWVCLSRSRTGTNGSTPCCISTIPTRCRCSCCLCERWAASSS